MHAKIFCRPVFADFIFIFRNCDSICILLIRLSCFLQYAESAVLTLFRYSFMVLVVTEKILLSLLYSYKMRLQFEIKVYEICYWECTEKSWWRNYITDKSFVAYLWHIDTYIEAMNYRTHIYCCVSVLKPAPILANFQFRYQQQRTKQHQDEGEKQFVWDILWKIYSENIHSLSFKWKISTTNAY